ncbi:MAG: uncharacterized metal-binding protein YceD (DUF177 family) [Flavobacteriales bacterium]|jgi:uncharacterized metal-binding protein YceD (DUF177 family)
MHVLKEYNVVFSGLSLGEHSYDYKINRSLFDYFEYSDFEDIHINVHVVLEKQDALIMIHFEINGDVDVNCDRCGDDLTKSLKTENTLVLKFSDHIVDEGDDLITLPNTAYEINLAQYIYEYTALAIPARRVHEEDCMSELSSDVVEEEAENIDPRWNALEQLKKNR